jgi:hypothetical protein
MMDKFPEAFKRFEKKVSLRNVETFRQLALLMASWSGPKWMYSRRQMEALAVEARKRGIPTDDVWVKERRVTRSPWISQTTWKNEAITIRGKSQQRYRDIKTGRFIKKPS